jgi:hypothetical protein
MAVGRVRGLPQSAAAEGRSARNRGEESRMEGQAVWPFLACVTATGIDDATDLVELAALSRRFPSAEWGVLLGPEFVGQSVRFPTSQTVDALLSAKRACEHGGGWLRLAGHLCGDWAMDLMAGGRSAFDALGPPLVRAFSRWQLNIGRAVDRGRLARDAAALGELLKQPEWHLCEGVIIQCGSAEGVSRYITEATRSAGLPFQVLFDESAGRSREVESYRFWDGFDCGLAGGLSHLNLGQHCAAFARIVTAAMATGRHQIIWVDAEGALRDSGNHLDLVRVRQFLEAGGRWVTASRPQPTSESPCGNPSTTGRARCQAPNSLCGLPARDVRPPAVEAVLRSQGSGRYRSCRPVGT